MLLSQLSQTAQAFLQDIFNLSEDINHARSLDTGFYPYVHPLHYAAQQGNLVVLAELLAAGADPNQLDDNPSPHLSATPLMYAVRHGKMDTKKQAIEDLVFRGASVNRGNPKGENALTHALYLEDVNTFEFLLRHGSNPVFCSDTAVRLKNHLCRLMLEKPHQFCRVLRLLAYTQRGGSAYYNFEIEFLKTLDKYRNHILGKAGIVTDPNLPRLAARNLRRQQFGPDALDPEEENPDQQDDADPNQLNQPNQNANVAPAPNPVQNNANDAIQIEETAVPEAPEAPLRLFVSTNKLLSEIKTGEDVVSALRADLDRQSFRAFLEMTSRLDIQRRRAARMATEDEQKTSPESNIPVSTEPNRPGFRKLSSDLEHHMAVQFYNFTNAQIQSKKKAEAEREREIKSEEKAESPNNPPRAKRLKREGSPRLK